jgi:hypothetical protein
MGTPMASTQTQTTAAANERNRIHIAHYLPIAVDIVGDTLRVQQRTRVAAHPIQLLSLDLNLN